MKSMVTLSDVVVRLPRKDPQEHARVRTAISKRETNLDYYPIVE